ncbi:MAG: cytidyltransferase-related domain [Rhodospirillales bacterium]|nr:cytidyltransferase-related domain [Rhodospirillales bacterium]
MAEEKYRAKIKTVAELIEIIGQPPRARKKKVIMCHGAFDVVHPGHIRHLMYAKDKAAILVASLTCDDHIVKASFRPFVPEQLRALNLAAMDMVDYVIIDANQTPLQNLRDIKPDYFAKGYEYVSSGLHPKTKEEKDILDSYGGEIIFTPGDVVYSSTKLLETQPPNIGADKLLSLLQAEDLSFDDLRNSLDRIKGLAVHIVGDTIVDSYTETAMIGGQTKTPTMSVRYESVRNYVGGAGVVAKHLKAAGADVTFTTVLGDDAFKDLVLNDLKDYGVTINAIIDPTRPTTHKNAIVCDGYRLLKIDTLDNRTISDNIQARFHTAIRETPASCVVFSDFRHGIFNRSTIPGMVAAIPAGTFRVADSQVASRWGNILEFQEFDLITPNEREARFALGDQDSVVRPLALKLYQEAKCKSLILKLGERGLLAYRPRANQQDLRSFFVVDSFAGTVRDAVGSGDALLAYATLVEAATGNSLVAAIIGAFAAAAECEYDGNIPVTPQDVMKKINRVERAASFVGDDEDR